MAEPIKRLLHTDPQGTRGPLRIERVYAWVLEEEDGGEGIPAIAMGPEANIVGPLIGADRARIESFRLAAIQIHHDTGRPVRLVCFEGRHELERIGEG
jgi:hypothetical protein